MADLEHDIDHLFRKAGEHYRVKPGPSQWDEILAHLPADNGQPASVRRDRRNLLLLFLPFILFSVLVLSVDPSTDQIDTMTKKGVEGKAPSRLAQPGPDSRINGVAIEKSESESKGDITIHFNQPTSPEQKKDFTDNTTSWLLPVRQQSAPGQAPVQFVHADSSERLMTVHTITADSTAKHGDTTALTDIHHNGHVRHAGFYAGVVAGVSFSEVKSQGMRRPGFDAGLVAGYRLSSHWALESGVLLNQRHYFTDGKYFSMDKIGPAMPSEMKILKIDGRSTIIEIPVSVEYTLWSAKRSFLSIASGTSSYILSREKNDYYASMNGANENITGSYKQSSKYVAASVDISFRFYHASGNNANFRIEPYVQLPLKGIGVGSLPVTCAGVHFSWLLSP